jgi:hypothetical protein
MQGTFDAGGFGIKLSQAENLGMLFYGGEIYFCNYALQGGVLRNIRINNLVSSGDLRLLNTKALKGQGDYNTYYDIYAGTAPTTGGTVARVYARSGMGVDDYRMSITRAGNITLLANKIFNPSAGVMLLPLSGISDMAGAVYYNIASDELRVYDGLAWNVN